jgi:lipoprotein-anchoring transpeptidase ErfK/SrfK
MTRRGRRLSLLSASVAAVAAGVSVAALAAGGGRGSPASVAGSEPSPSGPTLAPPAEPALDVPQPEPLRTSRFETAWAAVKTATPVRASARRGAAVVGRLGPRTPEGTTNIVLALDRVEDAQGALWIRVRVPALPENVAGWVPRSTLGGYGLVRTRLVVDLSDRRLTLFRDGKAIFRAPVGVGTEQFPTPTGDFHVRNKLSRYRNAFYGPVAFGTSARSTTLTDWPAGGFVGVHGTNRPELIPGRVSHGCIRLRNEAILRLAGLLPIGTPLRIRA